LKQPIWKEIILPNFVQVHFNFILNYFRKNNFRVKVLSVFYCQFSGMHPKLCRQLIDDSRKVVLLVMEDNYLSLKNMGNITFHMILVGKPQFISQRF
jgi:hypothetical protein